MAGVKVRGAKSKERAPLHVKAMIGIVKNSENTQSAIVALQEALHRAGAGPEGDQLESLSPVTEDFKWSPSDDLDLYDIDSKDEGSLLQDVRDDSVIRSASLQDVVITSSDLGDRSLSVDTSYCAAILGCRGA